IRNVEKILSEDHKVLIFSQFVKNLHLFRDHFAQKNWEYSLLTGGTSEKNRQMLIDQFKNQKNNRLFLISLKAGGLGLNLTDADYVFMLDPWWNPAVERQAINRAHRIGQDKNVFVYKFITRNTVEEKILTLQKKKSQLANLFINENNPLKSLSLKELKDLM
ncbi:MAG: DEAD/DEAH box helicase, partial [Bacteroidota bacterium]